MTIASFQVFCRLVFYSFSTITLNSVLLLPIETKTVCSPISFIGSSTDKNSAPISILACSFSALTISSG